MNKDEITALLCTQDRERLKELLAMADLVRKQVVGDEVHLRGLIEVSNFCARQCGYCGIRAGNKAIKRYRMTEDEVMGCAGKAVEYGYGTVVIQGGEDYGIGTGWLAGIIRRIKKETPLAVTLSLGERPEADLVAWKEAGADRYLLRFETSDPELYRLIHPDLPGKISDRIELLRRLRALGYEIGGGVMVGIPGQSYASLAKDVALFAELDLDMIGIGPYITHPATPLGQGKWSRPLPPGDQVPNTEIMVLKTIALARIACPEANIPATTALATIAPDSGREQGLSCGANVVMPNLTPLPYRSAYEIYPAKAAIDPSDEASRALLARQIEKMGRSIGKGQGPRLCRIRITKERRQDAGKRIQNIEYRR
jgi:biotin synthase